MNLSTLSLGLPNKMRSSVTDLRQFKYFAAIKECGSITSAAASLGISQPSLSEFIRRLEADLDSTLVTRSVRGIELTEAGLVFAKYSMEILAKVDAARDHVRSLGLGVQECVEIGLPAVIAGVLAVPLTETVRHEFGGKKVYIDECSSNVAIEKIRKGDLDFGVGYQDFDLKGGVYAQPLMEEQLFVLAAPDDWEVEVDEFGVALEAVSFEEVADKPLVLTNENSAWRRTIDRVATSYGIKIRPVVEIDSLSSMVSLARRASAISIAPQSAAFAHAARGELVLIPISDSQMCVRSFIIRKHGRPISQFSLLIENLLVQVLNENISRFKLHATVLRGF